MNNALREMLLKMTLIWSVRKKRLLINLTVEQRELLEASRLGCRAGRERTVRLPRVWISSPQHLQMPSADRLATCIIRERRRGGRT